jgi:hypothetical protein
MYLHSFTNPAEYLNDMASPVYSCVVSNLSYSSLVCIEEGDSILFTYLLTVMPIFPLALAAVDVDDLPFTLRLA